MISDDAMHAAAERKRKRKAEEMAKIEAERAFEARRRVIVNGLKVIRPLDVPEGAEPAFIHGRDIDPMATHSFIVWKWTEDGVNTKAYKQPVAIDCMVVSSDTGPIRTVYSATDENGRYMGDYTRTTANDIDETGTVWLRKAGTDKSLTKAKWDKPPF